MLSRIVLPRRFNNIRGADIFVRPSDHTFPLTPLRSPTRRRRR